VDFALRIVSRALRQAEVKLSRHFTVAEFTSHDGTPMPRAYRRELRRLCRSYLEPLRRAYGPVRIYSGHRSARRNRDARGASASYHLAIGRRQGAAADVRASTGSPREWYELLDALGAPGLGYYDDHIHVDNRRGHARW